MKLNLALKIEVSKTSSDKLLKELSILKVHAGGSGLERGVQGQPTDFNVWTREAGHGSLAISVEGPSKAIVDFKVRMTIPCFS